MIKAILNPDNIVQILSGFFMYLIAAALNGVKIHIRM